MTEFVQVSYLRKAEKNFSKPCCCQCGGELFEGEVYYHIEGMAVCRECLDVFARRYFRACRRRLEAVR